MRPICILFCIVFFSCSREKKPPISPVFPVKTAKVRQIDIPLYRDTIGRVEPILRVDVTSRVQGQITGVYFQEGSPIKKGDLLFTIDPRTLEAEVKKAEGVLQQRLANLDIAREKVVRFSPLTDEDYYAKLQFDALKSKLHAAEGAVKQAEANLQKARVELGYCWIYSPIKGRAGILKIDEGNILTGDDQKTLVTIHQMHPMYVSFSLPEKDLGVIRKYRKKQGPLRTTALDPTKQISWQGKLEMINNQIDPDTGTITLRSVFSNKEEALWPGKYVQVRLILSIQKDALMIPFSAVNRSSKGAFVFVINGQNVAAMRFISTGQRYGDEICISKGLQPDEEVVIAGSQNLYPGALVSKTLERGL